MSRLGGILVCAVFAASCGKGDNQNKSPTGPPLQEPVRYLLTVFADSSVVGEPKSGTFAFLAGERVSYSYAPAKGFRNATVVIDSVRADSAGTLVTSRNHVLFVAAEPAVNVPVEDVAGLNAALDIVGASDMRSAVKAYLAEIALMFDRYGAEKAHTRALNIELVAFGSATLVDQREFGKVLAAEPYLVAAESATLTGAGADVIFVPGMWTLPWEALRAAVELAHALRQAGVGSRVLLVYNETKKPSADEKALCALRTMPYAVNPKTAAIKFFGCYGRGYIVDVAESARQILEILQYVPLEETKDAERLLAAVEGSRHAGRAVVGVGYSQGTLIWSQAASLQGYPDPCIAGVHIAGPVDPSVWLLAKEPRAILAGGERVHDILRRLGLNLTLPFATSITRDADKVVQDAEHSALVGTLGVVVSALVTRLSQEVRLHSLDSYLSAPESRAWITTAVREFAEQLLTDPACRQRAETKGLPTQIYATSGQQLFRINTANNGEDTSVAFSINGRPLWVYELAMGIDGRLWGTEINSVFEVDTLSGAIKNVCLLEGIGKLEALTVDTRSNSPTFGMLFATSGFDLVYIDSQRCKWHVIGRMSGPDGLWLHEITDLAFSPDGTLYASLRWAGGTRLASVNTQSAVISYMFTLSSGQIVGPHVSALAWRGSTLYAFTSWHNEREILAIDMASYPHYRVVRKTFNGIVGAT